MEKLPTIHLQNSGGRSKEKKKMEEERDWPSGGDAINDGSSRWRCCGYRQWFVVERETKRERERAMLLFFFSSLFLSCSLLSLLFNASFSFLSYSPLILYFFFSFYSSLCSFSPLFFFFFPLILSSLFYFLLLLLFWFSSFFSLFFTSKISLISS